MWLRRLKYFLLKFLRLKDSPRSAALGFTLGAITNFLPILGFGGLTSVLLAAIFRANIIASLIGHYLFAVVFPLMFYANIRLGQVLLREQFGDVEETLRGLVELDFQALGPLTKSFMVGAGVNVAVVGAIIFLITFTVFKSYRRDAIKWLQSMRPLKKFKHWPNKNKKTK